MIRSHFLKMMIILLAGSCSLRRTQTDARLGFSIETTGASGSLALEDLVINDITLALLKNGNVGRQQASVLAQGALSLLDQRERGVTLWAKARFYLTGIGELNRNDITQVAPVIIEGVFGAMNTPGAALAEDNAKIGVAGIATQAMFASLNDKIAGLPSEKRTKLPGAIAGKAVGSLDNGGISTKMMATGIGAVVKQSTAGLVSAGFSKAELTSAVKSVAQGSMKGLADSGLDAKVMAGAAKSLMANAVSGLGAIKDSGMVEASDISGFVGPMMQSAVGAMGAMDVGGTGGMQDMIGEMMSGAVGSLDSAGVTSMEDIKSAVSDCTSSALAGLDDAGVSVMDMTAMVDNIVGGAISALGDAGIDNASDIQDLSSSIASSAISEAVDLVMNSTDANGDVSNADLIGLVMKDVASGTMDALGNLSADGLISMDDMMAATGAITQDATAALYDASQNLDFDLSTDMVSSLSEGMVTGLAMAGLNSDAIASVADDISSGIGSALEATGDTSINVADFQQAAADTATEWAASMQINCEQAGGVWNADNTCDYSLVAPQASVAIDVVSPSDPSDVIFNTDYTTFSAVTMSWTASQDDFFLAHNAKMCKDNACSLNCLPLVTTPDSWITITDVPEGSYYGCVQGVDTSGNRSAWIVSAATLTRDITPPASLTAVAFDGTLVKVPQVTLSWSGGDDLHLANFEVMTCADQGCSNLCSVTMSSDASPLTLPANDGDNYYGCVRAVDKAGNTTDWVASSAPISVDLMPPWVNAITPLAADGYYKAGSLLQFSVQFSEPVTVTDAVDLGLTLNTIPNQLATYSSGSGSNTLLFNYTVQPGDTSSHLDYGDSMALSAGTGSIRDAAGNDAFLFLAAPSSPNQILVDTTKPTVPSAVAFAGAYSQTAAFTMTWTDSTDDNFATHNVQLCADDKCSTDCVSVATASSSSASMSGSDGVTYYGCVQGQDLAGNTSAWVASASHITVFTSTPGVPANVAFAGLYSKTASFNMSWTGSTSGRFKIFHVMLCSDADCKNDCTSVNTASSSPGSMSGVDGNTYFGCVATEDLASNLSAWVASQDPLTVDQTAPTDPADLSFTGGNVGIYAADNTFYAKATSFDLSWTESSDLHLSHYKVQLCDTQGCGGTCTSIGNVGVAAAGTMTGVNGSSYYGCAKAVDLAGNTSAWIPSANKVTVDTVAPTVPGNVGFSGAYVASTTFDMHFNGSTDTHFDTHNVKLCAASDCTTDCTSLGTAITSPASMTGADGVSYYGCVQGQDRAGNTSAWAHSSKVTVDTTRPTVPSGVSFTGGAMHYDANSSIFYASGTSFNMSWTDSADDHFSTHNVQLCSSSDCLQGCTSVATALSSSATMIGVDGTSYFGCVQGVDLAGNTSDWVASDKPVKVDTTAPTDPSSVGFGVSYTNSTSFNLSWSASYDANPDTYNVKLCTGANCSSCSGDTTASSSPVSLSGTDGASYYGCVQAVDLAGHTSAWVSSLGKITVDTTQPEVPTSVGFASTYTTSATFSMLFTPGVESHPAPFNLMLCDDSGCGSNCIDAGANVGSPAQVTGADGGVYHGCVQGTDLAGNSSVWVGSLNAITVDLTNPTDPSAVGFDSIYSKTLSFDMNFTASEDDHFDTHRVKLCPTSACATDTGCGNVGTASISPASMLGVNGSTYHGCVQGRDLAGRTSAWVASTATVTVDTIPPTLPGNVGFPDGASAPAATFQMTWTPSTDLHFSTHEIMLCTANDCLTGCISQDTAASPPAAMTGVDGETYFGCVRGMDLAGNPTAWVHSAASITVNVLPGPPDPSITIENGAPTTTLLAVNLKLSATGASEMYITPNSGCASGGAWENFSSRKSWLLNPQIPGMQYIYVKYRNANLLESSCVGASIIYTNPPPFSISSGSSHSCAVTSSGGVKCWGSNAAGELGIGTYTSYGTSSGQTITNATTVNLGSGETALQVAAGKLCGSCSYATTCALLRSGAVKCWGDNVHGQLGLSGGGTLIAPSATPINLGIGRYATQIAVGGAHVCALLDDTAVKCWGYNASGQLGLNNMTNRGLGGDAMGDTLGSVDFGQDAFPSNLYAVAVTAGSDHSCAILNDHSVKCWGTNLHGECGQAHTSSNNTIGDGVGPAVADLAAIDLGSGRTAVKIAAGNYHTCAILDDGSVKCWGVNDHGQLGINSAASNVGYSAGSMGDSLNPVVLGSGRTAIDLALGGSHSCALLDNGTVKCWGKNGTGQLGTGSTNDLGTSGNPINLSTAGISLGLATAISAGDASTCVILNNDQVTCWGSNAYGALGMGTSATPFGAYNTDIPSSLLIQPLMAATSLQIFMTNQTSGGNLGGIAGADVMCNSDGAKPGNTPSRFAAILVDGVTRRACTSSYCGTGVYEHIDWALQPNTSYVRPNLTTIGTTTTSGIFPSINTQMDPNSSAEFWTGLYYDWTGDPGGGSNCQNWTTSVDSYPYANPYYLGIVGITHSSLINYEQFCSVSDRLACAEQPITPPAASCNDLYGQGVRASGVYTILPDGVTPHRVYCDMNSAWGGGWTLVMAQANGASGAITPALLFSGSYSTVDFSGTSLPTNGSIIYNPYNAVVGHDVRIVDATNSHDYYMNYSSTPMTMQTYFNSNCQQSSASQFFGHYVAHSGYYMHLCSAINDGVDGETIIFGWATAATCSGDYCAGYLGHPGIGLSAIDLRAVGIFYTSGFHYAQGTTYVWVR